MKREEGGAGGRYVRRTQNLAGIALEALRR
jgi:hypothetical protein